MPKSQDIERKQLVILLVDDDKICHDVLKLMLKYNGGHDVVSVYSAADALNFLKNEHNSIDIILLDINLPDMYGYELYSLIQKNKNYAKIPVIFQTGLSKKESLSESIASDVNIIHKPYKAEDLLRVIESIFCEK